jgi:NAD(P)-dependent dehydrogenase (short-subunit alcohol dehydrogenase family)
VTQGTEPDRPLEGKVALVAGATRGAGRGTALALGEAGATVYCTGRSTRERRSEYDRPETIEETAELVDAEGSPASTASPTSTAPGPTAGGTWSRSRTLAGRPIRPAIAELERVWILR